MKNLSTLFLQVIVVLVGLGALTFMLVEPHYEGRNINATVFQIYFNDPFLAYAYITSVAFFTGLYQVFKVLGYVGQDKTFSPATVKSLRILRRSALTGIGFVVVGMIYIRFFSESDDPAGGLFIGFLITFASLITAAVATTGERVVQSKLAGK
jgi:hypothetical protein